MAVKNPIIEHAKKMLMDKYGITEPEAHRFLNKTSMQLVTPKLTIARRIIRRLGGNPADIDV